jgi:hypothetical protein
LSLNSPHRHTQIHTQKKRCRASCCGRRDLYDRQSSTRIRLHVRRAVVWLQTNKHSHTTIPYTVIHHQCPLRQLCSHPTNISDFLAKILVTANDQSLNDKIVTRSVHTCPIVSRLNVTKVIARI